MTLRAGPLCEEPMMGVVFIVESFGIDEEQLKKEEQIIKEEKGVKEDDLTDEIKLKENEQNQNTEQQQQQQQSNAQDNKEQNLQPQKLEENEQNIQNDQQKQKSEKDEEEKIDSQSHKNSVSEQNKMLKKLGFKVDPYGPISGQIISTMKETCLEAFQGANPRLVEGMYECSLQTDQEYYGKVYGVLNKRRAQILSDDLQGNSILFFIKSHLPVQESIGFYREMLQEAQGRVNPQLQFDTWKILEIDPFYTPKTEEEIEEFGEEILLPNLAKTIIDKIRKRKGIFTTEKIVVAADKQRNLSKKK